MKLLRTLGLSLLGLAALSTAAEAQKAPAQSGGGYNIRVKIEDYSHDTLILGYRLGSKTYVRDTALRSPKGDYLFEGQESLKGGVYLILLKPDNIYFEFLVGNDQEQKNMSISTRNRSDKNLVKELKIPGSKENEAFLGYLTFLSQAREKAEAIGAQRAELEPETQAAKIAELDKKLEELNKEVTDYQDKMIAKDPKMLSSRLVSSARQPDVPKAIQDQGQEAAYRYFKAHYFDGFPWDDMRLIRTPVLEEKIETYLEKLTIPHPDSVIISVEELMQYALKGKDKDVFQFVAAHLLNKYAGTKLICMDKVYVYLGERYYCSGKADWVEKEQLEKICENVAELRNVLCDNPAPPFKLKNIQTGQQVDLYATKAKFTVVYFWDPACGNCTKSSEALVPVYEKYKNKGVQILGICSKAWNEVDACKEKINNVGMKWINLSEESYPLAVVKKYYDIKVNPFIYLLDENKKIMWKRIDPQQLDDILEREFKKIEEERLKKN